MSDERVLPDGWKRVRDYDSALCLEYYVRDDGPCIERRPGGWVYWLDCDDPLATMYEAASFDDAVRRCGGCTCETPCPVHGTPRGPTS